MDDRVSGLDLVEIGMRTLAVIYRHPALEGRFQGLLCIKGSKYRILTMGGIDAAL